ncbi:RNA-binding domain-containing protein [Halobacterium sp. CBA1126]|uniref:RNA-binding domain-containing protein n=1 Tax=Halobacterium TaxID=2239 RepID=UPI0013299E68|nr:coaE operon protein [Halobacterium sp. CBA1126]
MSDDRGVLYSVDVQISAPVKPTEVTDRVAEAVTQLFPSADVETTGDRVTAETHDVEAFREQLFEQRILDTARKEFLRNSADAGFSFDLKKQAAYVGKVNFSVGSPDELGDIHVEVAVTEPDVESFIAYLAPKTEDGEPVDAP